MEANEPIAEQQTSPPLVAPSPTLNIPVKAVDDFHRECENCKKVLPKDARYYESIGRGYFRKKCLQCTHELHLANGQPTVDPKMGMDRAEWRVWKKTQQFKNVAGSPGGGLVRSMTTPSWFGFDTVVDKKDPTVEIEGQEPKEPEQKPVTFSLDSNQSKKNGIVWIRMNDYFKVVPSTLPKTKPKSVSFKSEPEINYIPARSQQPAPSDDEDEESSDDDEDDEDEDQEGVTILDLKLKLIRNITISSHLGTLLGITPAMVHEMTPEDVVRYSEHANSLKGMLSVHGLFKGALRSVAEVCEHTTTANPKLNERMPLEGYGQDVNNNQSIDACLYEVIDQYQDVVENITPDWKLAFLMLAQMSETTTKNRERRKHEREQRQARSN